MLDEYALRFYTFLEVSIKMDAQEWVSNAMIASTPYMQENERKKLIDTYQHAGRDIIEEIREAYYNDGMEQLKEQFK